MTQAAVSQSVRASHPQKGLPDVNAETYPFGVVQEMLDETANFSMFATPVAGHLHRATLDAKNQNDWFNLNGGYGLELLSNVARFESVSRVSDSCLSVSQNVGETTGRFRCL